MAEWKGVLSQEKVGLIQSSYQEVVQKVGGPGFGKEFYDVLFTTAPEAKALFKMKRETQEKMFANTLTLLVTDLDDAGKVVPALTTLATGHVKYGVKEAHFPLVGGALLGTLDLILGPDFPPAVKEAWTELWGTATSVMVGQIQTIQAQKQAS